MDDPEIADLMGAEWIPVVARTDGWSLSATPEIANVLAQSPRIRENLTATVIEHLSRRDTWQHSSALFFWQGVFPILQEDDLLWLMDMVIQYSGKKQAIASSLFQTGFRWFGPEFFAKHSESILAAYKDVPKIHELLDIHLEAWDLDKQWVRKIKADHLRSTRLQRQIQSQEEKQIPWPTAVQMALERLSTDSQIWLFVCQYLAYDGDWKPSPLSAENDMPVGWAHLSVTQKTLALAGARIFLIEHEPHVAEPGKLTNYSLAGYTAAALLVGQIESAAELAVAFRDKWIRTVVQHWSGNASDTKRALLRICRRLDPAQTLGLLRECILYEATTGQGAILATEGVEEITDEEVLAMLWECTTAPNLKTGAIRHLVVFLTKHGWIWFETQLKDVASGKTPLQTEQRVAVLGTVFRVRTADSWGIIWPLLQNDIELARSIFLELAYHHQYNAETGIHQVLELQLIDLYRKLAEVYPIEEDPPFEAEPQDSLPRRSVAEFRQEIPRILAGRDSQAGCDALALLASEFEQSRSLMQWHLRQSRERWRMKVWNRPAIADVTRLLLDPSAHLVTTSEDLLEVVIESLQRLQSRITDTPNPLVYDFWFIGKLGNGDYNHGPHYEEHVARRIAAWLQDDLQSRHPAVINREVVPRWQQRTDITVEAPLRSGNETLVPKVIIEIKGNWHPFVRTACGTQLVDAYLRNQVSATGIYLVVWFGAGRLPGEGNPRSSRLRSQDLSSASAEIAELVANQRDTFTVQGFVLDCALALPLQIPRQSGD